MFLLASVALSLSVSLPQRLLFSLSLKKLFCFSMIIIIILNSSSITTQCYISFRCMLQCSNSHTWYSVLISMSVLSILSLFLFKHFTSCPLFCTWLIPIHLLRVSLAPLLLGGPPDPKVRLIPRIVSPKCV